MLNLVAAAYEDGYAFVRESDELFVIRPPYLYRNKRLASFEMVERAVNLHGFSSEDLCFTDWASLIEYLKNKMVEKRKEKGHEYPNSEQIQRLVLRAPEHVVRKYLHDIRNELIPNREWKAAKRLLLSLLKNKAIKSDPTLLEQCIDLLNLCENKVESENNERLEFVHNPESTAEEFPLAFEYFGIAAFELGRRIRDEKQIMVIGR